MKNIINKTILVAALAFGAIHLDAGDTSYSYDDAQRLIKIEFADGGVINYGYDDNGNLTTIETTEGSGEAPEIVEQPTDKTVYAGEKAVMRVAAEGSGKLSYQWSKDGTKIAGGTESSLSFDPVNTNDAGAYAVIVTNSYGTAASQAATLTVNTATGRIQMAVDGEGQTDPATGSSSDLPLGVETSISATPDPGNSFVYWTTEGSIDIADQFTPVTTVTPRGGAVITAHFADSGAVVNLTLYSTQPSRGGVSPNGVINIAKNSLVTVSASPNDGYYFTGWSATPEIAYAEFNPYAAKTSVNIDEDTALSANFAASTYHNPGSTSKSKEKFAVKLDNSKAGKDSVKVSRMPLGGAFPIADFDPSKTQYLVIDGETVSFAAGEWKLSSSKASYKSAKDDIPAVKFDIDLKNQRAPNCSFSVGKTSFTEIDNSDGVDIFLIYNGNTYGANYLMDEKSSWSFNAKKNSSTTITDIPLTPMTKFAIEGAAGKFDSAKKIKNGVPQSKDSVTVKKAALDCPEPSDGDEVSLAIDDYTKVLNIDDFTPKGEAYSYQNKDEGVKIVIDFAKNAWSFSAKNTDATGISASDGVAVFMTIGDYEGAESLDATQKTTLTYPKK